MAIAPLETKAPDASSLKLQAGSLDPAALSMGTLIRELNLSRQPSWLLRSLMNALETQRIARKLGWSRPWNKKGLTIFRSLRLDRTRHTEMLASMRELTQTRLGHTQAYQPFVDELFDDPKTMFFMFCHNHTENGAFHEGLTLSLGRKVEFDRSKRDRIDVILEDEKQGHGVDGRIDRVRVYVNPWFDHRFDRHFHEVFKPTASSQELYETALAAYDSEKEIPSSQFEHWSIRYIDYFGSREFIPPGSRFL